MWINSGARIDTTGRSSAAFESPEDRAFFCFMRVAEGTFTALTLCRAHQIGVGACPLAEGTAGLTAGFLILLIPMRSTFSAEYVSGRASYFLS